MFNLLLNTPLGAEDFNLGRIIRRIKAEDNLAKVHIIYSKME
jgi:hypothetical protein